MVKRLNTLLNLSNEAQNNASVVISDGVAKLLSWWAGGIMLTLATAEWLLGLPKVSAITFVGLAFVLLTRVVHQFDSYWGRVLFTLNCNLIVFLSTDVSGVSAGWYLFYGPAMTLPFVMWELGAFITIISFISLPVVLFGVNFFSGGGLFFVSEPLKFPWLSTGIAFFLATSMITFFVAYFVFRMRSAYMKLEEHQVLAANSAKMASLGEMAGGIAHEINNPLAIIQGYLGQVERIAKNDPDGGQRFQKQILKSLEMVHRISKIVSGLRQFARDGTYDSEETFEVDQLIDDTLSFCESRFKSHGVDLRVIKERESVVIKGQKVQLSQVVLNLLNNAFDAVSELEEKWVKVMVAVSGKMVTLTFTDSGQGIPNQIQDKIMQPFFTTKQIGHGTGLGLSIAQGIVNRHRGRLYYDKTKGNTTFVLELPIAAEGSLVRAS